MAAHAFSPSSPWAFSKYEGSLVYRESAKTVRATQRNPVLGGKRRKKRDME